MRQPKPDPVPPPQALYTQNPCNPSFAAAKEVKSSRTSETTRTDIFAAQSPLACLTPCFFENLILLYDPAPSFCFVSLVSCVPSCSSLSAASSRLLLPVHSLTFLPWVLPSNFRPACRVRASRFQQRCNSFSFSSSSSSLLLSSPLFSSASGRMPERMTDRMFAYIIYI